MSYTDDIYAGCAAMLGELSDDRSAALRMACLSAEAELTSRLRQDTSPEKLGKAFINACSVLALSQFILLEGACGDASSVKLGSVSVSLRGAGSVRGTASTLRKQAEAMLSACLEDNGFCFMGVRG